MSETISIRVSSETMNRLETLAKGSKRSKAVLAREAIGAFLDSEEWRIDEMQIATSQLDAGGGVSHKTVSTWLKSWGKTVEIKSPR